MKGFVIIFAIALLAVGCNKELTAQEKAEIAAQYDCGDFSSQAEAQDMLDNDDSPAGDPYHLDADGDGEACESYKY